MRSTLKCDIICYYHRGIVIMKTKIIYISGNEVFDMADIRAAFDAVRGALNLDNDTVLFGVPVDADDAGIVETEKQDVANVPTNAIEPEPVQSEPEINIVEDENIITDENPTESTITETKTEIVETQTKKRGRPRKVVEETEEEPVIDETPKEEIIEQVDDEKVVPILSILSANDSDKEQIDEPENIEIIEDIIQEEEIQSEPEGANIVSEEIAETDDEPDLEQLLSAMKPLQEDIVEDNIETPVVDEIESNQDDEESVDATLAQLATEFAQNEDKIASETKNSKHGKIGKLRNILPFKQSKHKDQGLGDLFGWAGVAANDEDFSVPGFFTNAASRK